MYKYIRIQLIPNRKNSLQKQTNDLRRFVKLFGTEMKLHEVPYADIRDTFLIDLPEDELDACWLINAVQAYCYFHDIPNRLASERLTVPFDVFLRSLADE